MELTCSRCHQTVQDGSCYCPTCGLPQFVYSADPSAASDEPNRWGDAVRDANSVDWKSALRSALPLAIPAGLLCSMLSPLGIFGVLLIGGAAAWAVALYVRGQRPAWITVGAGARIGLVTGVIASWACAVISGLSLYAMRFWLGQGGGIDNFWQTSVNQWQAQVTNSGADLQTIASIKAILISQQGRAGVVLMMIGLLMATLVFFAIAGGALSARLLTRARRSSS